MAMQQECEHAWKNIESFSYCTKCYVQWTDICLTCGKPVQYGGHYYYAGHRMHGTCKEPQVTIQDLQEKNREATFQLRCIAEKFNEIFGHLDDFCNRSELEEAKFTAWMYDFLKERKAT